MKKLTKLITLSVIALAMTAETSYGCFGWRNKKRKQSDEQEVSAPKRPATSGEFFRQLTPAARISYLKHAIDQNNVETVSICFSADRGLMDQIIIVDGYEMKPLAYACFCGSVDIVKMLLAKGFDPNKNLCNGGITALMLAIFMNRSAVTRLLLAHRANVNARCALNGATALIGAICFAPDEVDALLRAGATSKINEQTDNGVTALICACSTADKRYEDKDRPEIISSLIENGASLELFKQDSFASPLICAVSNVLPRSVNVLLAAGANVNYKDKNGMTALMHAAQAAHPAIVRSLLNAYRKAAVVANEASDCRLQAVRDDLLPLLVPTVEEVNVKDKSGKSALWYAQQARGAAAPHSPERANTEEIIGLLTEAGAE